MAQKNINFYSISAATESSQKECLKSISESNLESIDYFIENLRAVINDTRSTRIPVTTENGKDLNNICSSQPEKDDTFEKHNGQTVERIYHSYTNKDDSTFSVYKKYLYLQVETTDDFLLDGNLSYGNKLRIERAKEFETLNVYSMQTSNLLIIDTLQSNSDFRARCYEEAFEQLQGLRNEISILSEINERLEKTIKQLYEDNSTLWKELENSKIHKSKVSIYCVINKSKQT